MIKAVRRLPRAVVRRADSALPGGRLRMALASVAALLAVALAAGVVVLGSSTLDALRRNEAGEQAAGAIKELTPKVLNYNHESIDEDIARVRSVTTGEYWSANALNERLRPTIVEQQASTEAVVRSTGVAQAEPDRVVALVFLNQTSEGKELSAPRVDTRVARVTADRVNGAWKIAGFEPL